MLADRNSISLTHQDDFKYGRQRYPAGGGRFDNNKIKDQQQNIPTLIYYS